MRLEPHIHTRIELDAPIMVVCLDGWVDAGRVLDRLSAAIVGSASVLVASFDPDELFNYRARRPMMHVDDGINTGIGWPEVEVVACRDLDGRDMLVVTGGEPDHRWQGFADAVVRLAQDHGVRLVVSLGAYPAATPHTREVRLSAIGTTPQLVRQVGFLEGRLQVPAGVHAAIERACAKTGLPTVGLWAPVPHYIADQAFPPAVVAVLEGLADVADRRFLTAGMQAEADAALDRIDLIQRQDAERRRMVSNLESQPESPAVNVHPSELPTGEDLAAEFTQFLEENDD